MKKTVLVAVATAVLVSACTTTDPYTGQQKVSNTAAGAGIGALAVPGSACWPAATTAAMR